MKRKLENNDDVRVIKRKQQLKKDIEIEKQRLEEELKESKKFLDRKKKSFVESLEIQSLLRQNLKKKIRTMDPPDMNVVRLLEDRIKLNERFSRSLADEYEKYKSITENFLSYYENYQENRNTLRKLNPRIFTYYLEDDKIKWGEKEYDSDYVTSYSIYSLLKMMDVDKTREYIISQIDRKFTEDEKEIVHLYGTVGNYTYKNWKKNQKEFDEIDYENINTKNTDEKILTLLSMFNKSDTIPDGLILFEGQGLYDEDIDDFFSGYSFVKKSPTLATINPLVASCNANPFAENVRSNIFIYRIKGNIKGILIPNSFISGGSREYTVLIQPNVRMTILKKQNIPFAMRNCEREGIPFGMRDINLYEIEITN